MKKLVKFIHKKPKVGIVFPSILFFNKKKTNIINASGGQFCKFGFAKDKFFGMKLEKVHNQIDDNFFYAPGSCFLVRSEVASEIGYFVDNIFMYWDDVDFSWRTRILDYEIKILKDTKIYHKISITIRQSKNAF